MKYKDFYKELLEEAKYERYIPILTGGDEVHQDFILRTRNAVKTLRRDDIIQWYLRWWRYLRWKGREEEARIRKIEYPKYKSDWLRDFEKKTGVLNVSEDRYGYSIQSSLDPEDLSHFLSLPIEKIQNFRFLYQDPREVQRMFEQYESEWVDSHGEEDQWIDMTEELASGEIEVVYQFPDKFAWFNLKRPYCDREGAAMGHCGNRYYNKKESHTIFSLRKIEKRKDKVFGRPSLTFIVDNITRNLGESKGRANEKPDEKYHPYILKLLTLKDDSGKFIINKIVGGGYAAESNFKISDLNETDKKSLFNVRKDLKPLLNVFLDEGITDELIQNVKERIGEKYSKSLSLVGDSKHKRFRVFGFENVMEMFDTLESAIPKQLKNYKPYVSGESYVHEFYDRPDRIDGDAIRTFLEQVEKNPRFNKTEMEEYIREKYSAEVEDGTHWIDAVLETDGAILEQAKQAIYQGEVSGVENQLYDLWYAGMIDLELEIELSSGETVNVHFSYDNDLEKWNSPIYMYFPIGDLLSLLDEGEISNIGDIFNLQLDIKGDMNVPYYGFDGYDKSVAMEYFLDNLELDRR